MSPYCALFSGFPSYYSVANKPTKSPTPSYHFGSILGRDRKVIMFALLSFTKKLIKSSGASKSWRPFPYQTPTHVILSGTTWISSYPNPNGSLKSCKKTNRLQMQPQHFICEETKVVGRRVTSPKPHRQCYIYTMIHVFSLLNTCSLSDASLLSFYSRNNETSADIVGMVYMI